MILPIYSDELFELITLADIEATFLQPGRVYRMLPELEPMEGVFIPEEEAFVEQKLEVIDVRIDVFRRQIGKGLVSTIQQTYLGFALCDDELALRIRAAWAPGQVTSAIRNLQWRLV